MRLTKIEIVGLHGYIDKTIPFHDDINLLVGINGSGKTSVLNIINWMMNPASLPDLCVTQFKKISLRLTYKNVNYELVCSQKGRRMTFEVLREGAKRKAFKPLEILLATPPDKIARQPDAQKKERERYQGLKPSEPEMLTYTFLQEIPKAVILGLDRTVTRESRGLRPTQPASAIEQIQEIANVNYSRYQSRMGSLNNQLRNQFMLSAFRITHLKKAAKPIAVKVDQIAKWRERFGKYLSETIRSTSSIKSELQQAAKIYFDRLEEIIASKKRGNELVLVSTEAQKLRHLITHLEKFEKDAEVTSQPIKSYLATLNNFFKDSSKNILFSSDTYQICFQVLDKKNRPVGTPRGVDLLSSGEKQLLTLFTFIKFSKGGVYIIDEPELSLHPRWQDGFLEAMKALMPPDTQLILATHSPAIVGKNRQYCIPLLPYNA